MSKRPILRMEVRKSTSLVASFCVLQLQLGLGGVDMIEAEGLEVAAAAETALA